MVIEKIDSGYIFSSKQLGEHFKVYAGPGAGKTHFIVKNIKNIVNSNPKIKNSKNRKILCITYTNAAVDEINTRLEGFSKHVHVCTIHSFIIDYIIKPYQTELKKIMLSDFDISVSPSAFITSQVEGLGICHGIDKNKIYDYINTKCGEEAEITYSKKIMGEVEINLKEYNNNNLKCFKKSSKINNKHVKPIKEYIWGKVKRLTHDEILYFGYNMVISNSLITYALRVQFPFIFVDEFQDTNPLQTKLIKHIGAKGTIVGVIGDKAQSIYSFQGAVPEEFSDFNINGTIKEYTITGNRRSTQEIVDLCNYIRSADSELIQNACKNMKHKKVVFLCGDYDAVSDTIKDVISGDGAVLTRTWAAAFKYMVNVDESQSEILKKIYNLYYPTSIDIRKDISEHNYVRWVRALRFIVSIQQALEVGSISDMLKLLSYYIDLDLLKKNGGITPRNIMYIKKFFSSIFDCIKPEVTSISEIFDLVNNEVLKPENSKIKEILESGGTNINIDEPLIDYISEYDNGLNLLLGKLSYFTGVKLFNEVFSEKSKYMTVHHAKGREFSKVFVGVEPIRNDKVSSLQDTFLNPNTIGSIDKNEFARIFYVACSRAIDELYIHLMNADIDLISRVLDSYVKENNLDVFYEFR